LYNWFTKTNMDMKDIRAYQDIILSELQKLESDWKDTDLYHPIRHILSIGGKRIRPVLTLMATDFFQGDLTKSYKPALGIELFHNFTLLQDDIMDEAPLRRGKPTAHLQWGENKTILAGDVMFSKAFSLVTSCEDRYLRSVLDLFNETAIEVCEGQHMDMEFETRNDVSISEYLDMIRLKTAVILGCALKLGAILSDASPKDANAIYDFGVNLGIAFQIQDDILDVFAKDKTFGKQAGGDIIANKKTYLLIKALEDANQQQQSALKYWMKETDFNANQKVAEVTSIFSELQIREHAQQVMEHYYQSAIVALRSIDVPGKNKLYLETFARTIMKRGK